MATVPIKTNPAESGATALNTPTLSGVQISPTKNNTTVWTWAVAWIPVAAPKAAIPTPAASAATMGARAIVPPKPAVVPAAPVKSTTPPKASPKVTATAKPEAPLNNDQKIKQAWEGKTLDEQKAMVKTNPLIASAMAKYGLNYAKDNTPVAPVEPVVATPPAGTETATPATPATTNVQPDYQDDSAARIQEINDHLKAAYTNTPNLFADPATFRKNFNYDQRSDAQKSALDTFYQNKQNEKKYGNMSADQIGKLYANGQFDINDVSFMQTSNPAQYAAIQAAITAQNASITNAGTLSTLNGTTSPVIDNANSATAAATAALKTYNDTINAPDVIKKTEDINTLNGEISQIDLDIDKIKKEVETEYKDKGISKSLMNSIISDRTNDYNNQKNSKLVEMNTLTNSLNSTLSRAKESYTQNQDIMKAQQQDFSNSLAIFNTQYGIQKDEKAYQLELDKLEAGKFAAVSDGMGWITVYNTKTGEVSNNSTWMTSTQASEYSAAGGWYLNVPRTGNNVGNDTNNFGNITSAVDGSIGMYKSPNGRSYAVFANAQDWYNALVKDLTAKQTGKTKTGLNGNSTFADLCKTWVGSGVQQSYIDSAAKAAWVNANDKIGSIDVNKLATGIMAAEWTLKAYQAGGKDLGNLKGSLVSPTTSEYSPWQMSYMDMIVWNPTTDQIKIMKTQLGLNLDDLANYKAQKVMNNTDYSSILNSLSPWAKSIAMGKASLSNVSWSGQTKAQLQTELAASGIDSMGMGNQQYRELKQKDKEGLAQFLQTWDRFAKIQALLDKGTDTGWDENFKNWVTWTLGIWTQNTDFNQLKQLAGKELVSFIKSISGTAVSNEERAALMALLPSASNQQIGNFKDSFASAQREYETLLDQKANAYWFDTVEAMRAAIGMSAQPNNTTNNSWVNPFATMLQGIQNPSTTSSLSTYFK